MRAREYFERAIAIDPRNVGAIRGVGFVEFLLGQFFCRSRQALATGYGGDVIYLGSGYFPRRRRFPLGHGTCPLRPPIERCRLSRNSNTALLTILTWPAPAPASAEQSYIGHAEETEAEINQALRLSPRDTLAYFWFNQVGFAKGHARRIRSALPWLTRSIEANKFSSWP